MWKLHFAVGMMNQEMHQMQCYIECFSVGIEHIIHHNV